MSPRKPAPVIELRPQVPQVYRCLVGGCRSSFESAGVLPGRVCCFWCGAEMVPGPKERK